MASKLEKPHILNVAIARERSYKYKYTYTEYYCFKSIIMQILKSLNFLNNISVANHLLQMKLKMEGENMEAGLNMKNNMTKECKNQFDNIAIPYL